MKEEYIKGKILSLTDKVRGKDPRERMERDRIIARCVNMINEEFALSVSKLERHMQDFIIHTIRRELR